MPGKIVRLKDYKEGPYYSILCSDGNVHIIPKGLIRNIASGNITISECEEADVTAEALCRIMLDYLED